jgi:hypothetical protein
MRTSKVPTELGSRFHRPGHNQLAIGDRLTRCYGAVVAAKAQLGRTSQWRLQSRLVIRGACIRRVGLHG